MKSLSSIRGPKRLIAAAAVSGLVLILAGCGSPGAIGANSFGFSDGVPGDVVNFSFVCSTVTAANGSNCSGQGTGTIKATSFKTQTANGATFDSSNNECKKAPCPWNARLRVWGQAQYGDQEVTYHFQGNDPDPGTADTFQVTLDSNKMTGFIGSTTTFHCNGCVEVVMSPGHIPDSVYDGQ
jgi:hypothetical protein